MKLKNIINIFIISFILVIGCLVYIGADSGYWTNKVVFNNMPGGGASVTNMDRANTKKTISPVATFYAQKITASLGNYVTLANSAAQDCSEKVGLYQERVVRADEKSCAILGRQYYTKVFSNSFEWSNANTVILDFSADYITK